MLLILLLILFILFIILKKKKVENYKNKADRRLDKTDLIDKSIDRHTKKFDNKIFYKNNNELIEKTIDKIDNNEVIITFIDKNKIKEFNIFYKYFSKLNLNNLLVISLDTKIYNNLYKRNILTILLENYKDNLETINKIFKLGKKDLIYTKVEYIWKKNISKNIRYMDYDLIGYTTNNKNKIFDKYFFKIKYNIDTINLFDIIINKFYNKNKSDNVIINNYILNEKIKEEKEGNNKIIRFYNKNFKILLLKNLLL